MTEYVYAIQSGDRAIKFGRGSNPAARLTSMQTGNPDSLDLVNVRECPDITHAAFTEKFIHAFLRPFRLKGEWFNCSPTAVATSNLLCTPYLDHFMFNEIENSVEIEDMEDSRGEIIRRWIDYWLTDFNYMGGRVDGGDLLWRGSFPTFAYDNIDSDRGAVKQWYTDNYRECRHRRVVKNGGGYCGDLVY